MNISHSVKCATLDEYWYFTKHGVGPGSIPKGVRVLDVQEGQNKKGTWGSYFSVDRMLTTDELDYYDVQEEKPIGSSTHVHSSDDLESWTMEYYDGSGNLLDSDEFTDKADLVDQCKFIMDASSWPYVGTDPAKVVEAISIKYHNPSDVNDGREVLYAQADADSDIRWTVFEDNQHLLPDAPWYAVVDNAQSVEGASDVPDHDLNPPEDTSVELDDSTEEVEVDCDFNVIVEDKGNWYIDDPDSIPLERRYVGSEYGVYLCDDSDMYDHLLDILEQHIPAEVGKYHVTGTANVVFDVTNLRDYGYGYDDGEGGAWESDIDVENADVEFNRGASSMEHNLLIVKVQ